MSPAIAARLKAFIVHLLLSAAVVGGFLLLVFMLWYPGPFAEIYGVWDILLLLIGIDLIIGPLLTLVIYNTAKPVTELRRDVAIIVLLQLAALGWGAQSIYDGRPLYVVYAINGFNPVQAGEYREEGMDEGLRSGVFSPPQMVYLRPPADEEESQRLIMAYMSGESPDMLFLADRYEPLAAHLKTLRRKALSRSVLLTETPALAEPLEAFVAGREVEQLMFHRFAHMRSSGVLVLARETGEVLGYIPE